ncbi:MAG: rhodanese-like domain-containing protein [Desulfobacterales bacterium]|jgi:rhodanese-related sulfurtransferase
MGIWKAIVAVVAVEIIWEAGWWAAGVTPVSPWDLKKRLNAGHGIQVVDVRSLPEYRWFHIPGARHRSLLPVPETGEEPHELIADRPVVVVCMTGHRSPPAALQLKRRGFKTVGHLAGGMAGYRLIGGMTVKGGAP